MITEIEFIKDWRCFKKGITFSFRAGVNLLVGDQGTGKSSIFQVISDAAKPKSRLKVAKLKATRGPVQSFDFENDNPRKKEFAGASNEAFQDRLYSRFVSHGQVNLKIIECLQELMDKESTVIVMDEPDMALSIRSINFLVEIIKKLASKGHQIIVSAHNKQLIDSFEDVLSLEHGKWMNSGDFVADQLKIKG